MSLDPIVLRAAAGDTAALRVLVVAEQPFISRVARRYAAWCFEDVAQDASTYVLTGFRSFRLAAEVEPASAWRRWLRIVVRNTAGRVCKKLARGSSQSVRDAEAVFDNREATATNDMEATYESVRHAALECMPLGARFAWLAQEQRLPAKRLAKRLGLRGERGAHYHTQVARKVVYKLAAMEACA